MLSTYVKLQVALKSLMAQEEGQDMVEYALILGLVSIVAVVAVMGAGDAVTTLWDAVTKALDTATGAGA